MMARHWYQMNQSGIAAVVRVMAFLASSMINIIRIRKIDSSAGLRGHSSIDAVSYVVNAIPSQSSVFYASKKKTRPTVHDVTLPRTLMSNTGYLSQ